MRCFKNGVDRKLRIELLLKPPPPGRVRFKRLRCLLLPYPKMTLSTYLLNKPLRVCLVSSWPRTINQRQYYFSTNLFERCNSLGMKLGKCRGVDHSKFWCTNAKIFCVNLRNLRKFCVICVKFAYFRQVYEHFLSVQPLGKCQDYLETFNNILCKAPSF